MEQRRARRRCRIDDGEALRRCQCVQEEPALAQPPRRHCAPVAPQSPFRHGGSCLLQAHRLNEFPDPPAPPAANSSVPPSEKCPLSQEKSFSPLEPPQNPFFEGVPGHNDQLKSGSCGRPGPRAGPTETLCKIHLERAHLRKNRLRRARVLRTANECCPTCPSPGKQGCTGQKTCPPQKI